VPGLKNLRYLYVTYVVSNVLDPMSESHKNNL